MFAWMAVRFLNNSPRFLKCSAQLQPYMFSPFNRFTLFFQGFHVARVVLCQGFYFLLKGSLFSKVSGTRFFCPKVFPFETTGAPNPWPWLHVARFFLTATPMNVQPSPIINLKINFPIDIQITLQIKTPVQISNGDFLKESRDRIHKRNQFKTHSGKLMKTDSVEPLMFKVVVKMIRR